MPRASAEARAAAAFRAAPGHRAAPPGLNAAARTLWNEIVADRPADWFRPGSWELLEQYCTFTVQLGAVARALAKLRPASPEYPQLLACAVKLSTTTVALATKLRLTPLAHVTRWARSADEKGNGATDPLLGGEMLRTN